MNNQKLLPLKYILLAILFVLIIVFSQAGGSFSYFYFFKNPFATLFLAFPFTVMLILKAASVYRRMDKTSQNSSESSVREKETAESQPLPKYSPIIFIAYIVLLGPAFGVLYGVYMIIDLHDTFGLIFGGVIGIISAVFLYICIAYIVSMKRKSEKKIEETKPVQQSVAVPTEAITDSGSNARFVNIFLLIGFIYLVIELILYNPYAR